ncbi:hypothetical protein LLS1_05240 [Leifsonia sp. LS1]|uniref:AtuA-related protein n=1 Tax=Leifsonia sp. LS1 TaxID=2828483 RepID=UPI001CFD0083|nr:hypothetical protein [Leifsonia sp. LS1]GIT78855.1 hypothetical protein LLS1_05240 [Leifsonia sp. LS1]
MNARRLGDIAHARAGDKGDSSILFLAPYEAADFEAVCGEATADRLARHFQVTDASTITIRRLDALRALSIVIPHRLDGGVTRSASADPHGKTLSAHLLELPIGDGTTAR